MPQIDAKIGNPPHGTSTTSTASTPAFLTDNSQINNNNNDNVENVSNLFTGLGIASGISPREVPNDRKVWVSRRLSPGRGKELFRTPEKRNMAAPKVEEPSYLAEDPTVNWSNIWQLERWE